MSRRPKSRRGSRAGAQRARLPVQCYPNARRSLCGAPRSAIN
ncbi:hypothetical protein BSIN_1150 [Burkholderia singularis]|uniref:Uncharacterized protein n=1 Tax=Burkholderia singularis TaxID=1503053 RepID=A0A238HC54_9BURK|nr:hypothetical protein BSIN_1150 [Burkholderia singularis]